MQIPLDESGSLIRHPHRYPDPDEIVWEDAKPFQAHLILHDVRAAQGYGKYVIWREAHGIRRFPMDSERAFAVVKHTLIDHGAIIAATKPTWTFTKAHARGGEAYGIDLVRKKFLDHEGGDADAQENEE